MKEARRHYFQTVLKCPLCDNTQTIFRMKAKRKSKGHIKHLWCYRCKDRTGHVEGFH